MKNNNKIITLIASFYTAMYDNRTLGRDYRGEFIGLLRQLHERAFPGYKFDPEVLPAQARRQLRGNARAVENYSKVCFQFEPLSGSKDILIINIGATGISAEHPDGKLWLWTENEKINAHIQRILKEENEKSEDTNS